jgi:hypothetical protein
MSTVAPSDEEERERGTQPRGNDDIQALFEGCQDLTFGGVVL